MDAHCSGVHKGAWTSEEDRRLKKCIEKYGATNWCQVPVRAGLNRCWKSCRLRWMNYLNPGIERGSFEEDEQDLIIRLHKLLGNRWSLIAGRLPATTANDVKNYWNSHLSKKSINRDNKAREHAEIIKPKPWTVSAGWIWSSNQHETENKQATKTAPATTSRQPDLASPSKDQAAMSKELPNKMHQNHDSLDIEHIMTEEMGSYVIMTIDNAFESEPSRNGVTLFQMFPCGKNYSYHNILTLSSNPYFTSHPIHLPLKVDLQMNWMTCFRMFTCGKNYSYHNILALSSYLYFPSFKSMPILT